MSTIEVLLGKEAGNIEQLGDSVWIMLISPLQIHFLKEQSWEGKHNYAK